MKVIATVRKRLIYMHPTPGFNRAIADDFYAEKLRYSPNDHATKLAHVVENTISDWKTDQRSFFRHLSIVLRRNRMRF